MSIFINDYLSASVSTLNIKTKNVFKDAIKKYYSLCFYTKEKKNTKYNVFLPFYCNIRPILDGEKKTIVY